jgi:serine/threonine-protein kinase
MTNPTFSPDGTSIVFWSAEDVTLKRIPITGGAAATLGPADNPHGMAWEEADRIVFGQGTKGIFQISANGGKPDVLVAAQDGETLHGPHILPGGKALLFTSSQGPPWDSAKIFAQPLPSGERRLLIDGGTDARYLPTGHLIFFLAGNLHVVPFDLGKLEVRGRAVPVIEGVRFSTGGVTGSAQFSVSSTGTLIYWPAPPEPSTPSATSTIVTIIDTDGMATAVPLPVNPYVSVRVSPDGKQLAVGTDDGKEANIWVYDLSGKTTLRRLTLSGRNLYPVWSSDSKHVLFQSDRE